MIKALKLPVEVLESHPQLLEKLTNGNNSQPIQLTEQEQKLVDKYTVEVEEGSPEFFELINEASVDYIASALSEGTQDFEKQPIDNQYDMLEKVFTQMKENFKQEKAPKQAPKQAPKKEDLAIDRTASFDLAKGVAYWNSIKNEDFVSKGLLNPITVIEGLVLPSYMVRLFATMNLRDIKLYDTLDKLVTKHVKNPVTTMRLSHLEADFLLDTLSYAVQETGNQHDDTGIVEIINGFYSATQYEPTLKGLKEFIDTTYGDSKVPTPKNSITLENGVVVDLDKVIEKLLG